MRIKYDDMLKEFERVLLKKGFSQEDAYKSAKLYTENGLDGVYSHGVNRFPRTIEQIAWCTKTTNGEFKCPA